MYFIYPLCPHYLPPQNTKVKCGGLSSLIFNINRPDAQNLKMFDVDHYLTVIEPLCAQWLLGLHNCMIDNT